MHQHYTDDGTRIAYSVAGSGPVMLLTNGLTTDTTFWKYLGPIWARDHTVVSWDLPGHGQSGPARSREVASVEGQARLMAALLDAVGATRALQVGWSTGCQLVLEMYRQFPARCSGLALLFGPSGRVLDTTRLPLPGAWFAPLVRATPPRAFELLCRGLSRALAWPLVIPLGRGLDLIGPHTNEHDVQRVLEHIGTVDPATLREMLLSLHAHDAQSVLAAARVPLLILAGDRDPFAPAERVGVAMHASAPRSTLLRMPNATHTALLDDPEPIAQAVEQLAAQAR